MIGVPWLIRRLFPILGTIGLIVLGMAGTIWGPRYYGTRAWATPDDLWATLTAAQRLLHGDLGGLYTPPTNLVSFPGAAIILVPVVALIDAVGLPITIPGPPLGANHGVWLVAGCYQTVISAVVLFIADEIAERLGLSRPKRALLAAASAIALWNVTIRWGHPEDAVSTGLLLLAILALSESRTGRAGWLIGAAVAIQPLVLLALPILVAVIEPRRLPGFLARSAAPAAVLLAAAAAANWHATFTAVTKQPNLPERRPPDPVAVPRPAPEPRLGRRRARPDAGHRGGLRVRRRARPALAGQTARPPAAASRMDPGRTQGDRVVVRGGAGPALRVRVGDGRVLPVAPAGAGPDRRVEELGPPGHRRIGGDDADLRHARRLA